MPGSLLAGLGLMASELFKYNRENYKFDRDQMLERELMRVEMQVKRFELFREDIRDLIDLTVDRMDVYHLVGALFLEFCVVFFCEGRVQASAPPFLLSLFLLSNACSFVYLLLAVWLSMHASIASHSFGVRILTRFVRLPIPSASQIRGLTSTLAGFEFQGVKEMLRLPFVQAPEQQWSRPENSTTQAGEAAGTIEQNSGGGGAAAAAAPQAPRSPVAGPHAPLPAWAADRPAAQAQPVAVEAAGQAAEDAQNNADDNQVANQDEQRDLLGGGDRPFDDEHLLLRGATMPDKHVQLFRRLQAKWQCYDAYCRVCMTLGVNQILQGLTYFAICHTLVEHRSPSAGYALMLIFQSVALALARLDISGLHKWQVLAVQSVGTLPAFLAAFAIHAAERDEDGSLEPHEDYPSSPFMFFLQACWLELLLWVAAPSRDDAALPRRFRSVLFLDVFGDAGDPFEAEHRPNELNPTAVNDFGGRAALRRLAAERVAAAEDALAIAQAALRRWSAVPQPNLTADQSHELSRARNEMIVWRRALVGEIAWRAAVDGLPHPGAALQEELGGAAMQPWGELTPHEREEDPFAYTLIGPLEHDTGYEVSFFYYDVERGTYCWEERPQGLILTLGEVTMAVRALEASTRLLLGTAEAGETEEPERAAAAEATGEVGGAASLECGSAQQGLRGFLAAGLRALRHIPSGESRDIELAEDMDRPLLNQGPDSALHSGRRRRGRSRSLDRVQLAAAGPHARHFVPERLPWQLMRGVTRVLQLCWIFVSMMAALREVGLYRIDFQTHHAKERRLTGPAPAPASPQVALQAVESQLQSFTPAHQEVLSFESANVRWPHRLFFRPTALFCLRIPSGQMQLPDANAGGASSRVFLGSPFAFYKAQRMESGQMHLEALPDADFPAETVLFCSAASASLQESAVPNDGCLLGLLTGDGLAIWQVGQAHANSSLLQVAGRPWKLAAGAVLECASAARMLEADVADVPTLSKRTAREKWCLLLAGWDGKRLPVAVVPLPGWPAKLPGAYGTVLKVVPSFDVPLAAPPLCAAPGVAAAGLVAKETLLDAPALGVCRGTASYGRGSRHDDRPAASHAVVALHVEPSHGRLWALHEDGDLQAWRLLPPAKLGRWRPRWPSNAQGTANFEAAALCDDAHGGLLVVGRSEDVGADMLRAALPLEFHP